MSPSPTVRRIQLGRELKRFREAAGLPREAAAAELECDLSKISRLETGKLAIPAAEVRALLTLYGVEGADSERVQNTAREARKRTTYQVPDWARTFVGFEADAAEIKTYQAELVPGLLQTEAYIRAVTRAADPTRAPEEVDRLVAMRQERQRRLESADAPQLWVVMNEAVIRRLVGGPGVMREQLDRLVELSAFPKVSLQVLPFTAGAHAAMGSSFVVLRLSEPENFQIAYLEELWSADYVDKPDRAANYTAVFDRLCIAALDPDQTVRLVQDVREGMP